MVRRKRKGVSVLQSTPSPVDGYRSALDDPPPTPEPRDDVETPEQVLAQVQRHSHVCCQPAILRITERLATAEGRAETLQRLRDSFETELFETRERLATAEADNVTHERVLAEVQRERDEARRKWSKQYDRIAALTEGLRVIAGYDDPFVPDDGLPKFARTLLADQPTEEPAPSE